MSLVHHLGTVITDAAAMNCLPSVYGYLGDATVLDCCSALYFLFLLLLSGDIELNPGPITGKVKLYYSHYLMHY